VLLLGCGVLALMLPLVQEQQWKGGSKWLLVPVALALLGAFVFAELSTVLPKVGGQYAYFRAAFHPLVGFLHGWAILWIVQSGATAAVSVACAQYFAQLASLPQAMVTPMAVALLLLAGCATQTRALLAAPRSGPHQQELSSTPFYAQERYQCGPAALAMLLGAAGIETSPDALVNEVYLPGREGSLQIEMLAATRRHGALSWQLAPKLDDLLREVQAGTPVIVMQNYGLWPVNYWHYAVVVGFDHEAQRVVLRSGEKRRLEMPLAVLEYTWKDSGRWAMVAVPPGHVPATATEAGWLQAVVAMERRADRNAARQAYEATLQRWPQSLNAAIALANIHYADGRLPAAETLLRSAVEHHPDSAAALNNLAQVLADQQRGKEALPLIDRAVALGGPFAPQVQATREQIVRQLAAAQH